jgi:hypothetical protein
MEENLKTSDIIDFKESDFKKITDSLKILEEISKEYRRTDDVHGLEDIKKRLNAELQFFASLYAKVKVYKGTNHTYMEDVLKGIKSETINRLLDSNVKVTAAEQLYYTQPYYKNRLEVLLKIKGFFIKVEELFNIYNGTLQCVIQSISVASKEMQNSKMS